MKKVIQNCCLWTVKLLLCLFIFGFAGCSILKMEKGYGVQHKESVLQLAVNENDFSAFNQRIQELGLVAVDFRPLVTNIIGGENNEFWVTFRFASENALIRSYVSLMSNGSVRRISYPTQ